MARKPRTPKGFNEAQIDSFARSDALLALFEAYGFSCAFTGADLKREAAADPRGYLLNLSIDPATENVTLLIPATLDAIFAFERGHLAIGQRYNFLVDLEVIDPEFADRLDPIGRLRLPADTAFHPSLVGLTPHLIAFATGRRWR